MRPTPHSAAPVTQAEEAADLEYLLERVPQALDRASDGVRRVATIVQSMKEFAHPDDAEQEPFESAVGQGTTFFIRLPVDPAAGIQNRDNGPM